MSCLGCTGEFQVFGKRLFYLLSNCIDNNSLLKPNSKRTDSVWLLGLACYSISVFCELSLQTEEVLAICKGSPTAQATAK